MTMDLYPAALTLFFSHRAIAATVDWPDLSRAFTHRDYSVHKLN